MLETNYVGHDRIYQRLKAEGGYSWTQELVRQLTTGDLIPHLQG